MTRKNRYSHPGLALGMAAVAAIAGAEELQFIVGQRTRLFLEDLAQSDDGRLFRHVPIFGEVQGPLDFVVVAQVAGYAGYDTGFRCFRFERQADGLTAFVPSQGPNCHVTRLSPADRASYDVSLRVSCRGETIVSGQISEAPALDRVALDALRTSIDETTGLLRSTPASFYYDRTLMGPGRVPELRGRLQDASGCRVLDVEVVPRDGTRLEHVYISVEATETL